MTLEETLVGAYGALDAAAVPIFAGCVAVPVGGTLLAWVGRGGKTDRDGRFFANAVIALGFVAFVAQIVVLMVSRWVFDASVLNANVLLLLGPPLALGLGLLGVRLVFPLGELGSARTAKYAGLLVLAALALVWILSQFRGWGVVFFGSIAQLAILAGLAWAVIKMLTRKATGREGR